MGQIPLDKAILPGIERRSRQFRSEHGLSAEEADALAAQALKIFRDRVHTGDATHDASIDPENWCEGVGPVLEAIVHQACLDAFQSLRGWPTPDREG